ncbi:UDP-galactopyranose mutase [Oscillibacter ruminantium]|uniref:UDP-galactopyranose mutase n=1 Tax=Oscillibacter ruminantium TaxID=1263547 RepID=UPI000302B1A5|nr:UDP-galactopyranose mutase [Oscillibacter ruminantium]
MRDIIVIGSGFSGSILARRIAQELDRKVLVVESRSHIGGNAYDEVDEHGILVQKYGPHFLNTNHFSTIQFLMQYAPLFPHCAKLLSFIDGNYVRLPFNFQTMQELLGPEKAEPLLAKMRESFAGRDRVPILELVDHPDPQVREYGGLLFEKAYRTYTSKMWGLPPEKIDKYVLDRVPMAMNYDERYLNKDFQYLPVNGFHEIFDQMLDHPNIELRLNTDAMSHITLDETSKTVCYDGVSVSCLIFTGAIDELLGYRFGALPYRSLDIRYEYHPDKKRVQPCEIISYPQAEGYTRSTEYRQIMQDDAAVQGTVVATEYPLTFDKDATVGNIRYYPVNTAESDVLYQRYLSAVHEYQNIFLCGRLAEFKYYNMDICIEHALAYFEKVRDYLEHDA